MTPERKRVLFLVPAFAEGVGGAERVIATILRHLDHSKFECHLALVGTGGAYLEGVPSSVTLHELGASRMRYSLPKIIRLARKLHPQTILSTVMHLNVILILARPFLSGRPRILLREAILPSAFVDEEARYPRISRLLYRHLYPQADRVICLFDGMVNDMAEHFGIPKDKLVRIYNPIDVSLVRCLANKTESPYRDSGRHIVAMGRLQHQKAYDVLLNALPAVLSAVPAARLTILGEGPLAQQLKAQAVKLGVDFAVNFAGFQANPWPYVKHAELFVLCSRFEGMPNALLESLALGTPVVATDCPGGVREIQQAVGVLDLVPVDDPAALAVAMISALSRPAGQRGDVVSQEALRCFDPQQIAAEYSRLL